MTDRSHAIILLKDVVAVYESDLPSSRANADASIEKRWTRPKIASAQKELLKDFYDEFCIDIGLVAVELEPLPLQLSIPDVLWEAIKPLLDLLESLLADRLYPRRSQSGMAYPKLRRLRAELKSAKKEGKTISRFDQDKDGLVEFGIHKPDQENTLEILRRGRTSIAKLTELARPPSSGASGAQYDGNAEQSRTRLDQDTEADIRLTIWRIKYISNAMALAWKCCPVLLRIQLHLVLLPIVNAAASTARLVAHHGLPSYIRLDSTSFRMLEHSRRKVGFERRNSEPNESNESWTRPSSLCDLLEHCSSWRPAVWQIQRQEPENQWQGRLVQTTDDPPELFVSLDQLLQDGQAPSGQQRLDLMALLAKYFVQLGQQFPVWRMTKRDLLFRRRPSATTGIGTAIEFSQPFLGLRRRLDLVDDEGHGLEHFFHSHPFLLDLGVLLLELQYEATIEALATRELGDNPPAQSIYNDYVTALHMVSKPDFEKSVTKGCRVAIKACLLCDFLPAELDTQDPQFEQLTYENIIRPLELQQALGFDEVLDVNDWDEEDDMDEDADEFDLETDHPLEDMATAKVAPMTFLSLPVKGSENWHIFDERQYGPAKSDSADEWFRLLGSFHKRVICPLSEKASQANHKRTKVAILDTGVDRLDPFIRGAFNKGRIKEVRNWVRNEAGRLDPTDIVDVFGHGTHTAALVLKVAPFADVSVARVASGKLLDNGETSVAEAIIWAAETCNADIITMSFGFPERSDIVEEAIKKAFAQNSIMLAATSNDGQNRAIAYPASDRNVIGVFSSDGYGNKSPFSAAAPSDDTYLMTLGEAVESSWPRLPDKNGVKRTGTTMRKSGTSFATPIAAGIAANMLDYGKWGLSLGQARLNRLHSFDGMLAVLTLMAGRGQDGHRYLAPWRLWDMPESATEEDLEDEKNEIHSRFRRRLR